MDKNQPVTAPKYCIVCNDKLPEHQYIRTSKDYCSKECCRTDRVCARLNMIEDCLNDIIGSQHP